jgi:hypothetical protein
MADPGRGRPRGRASVERLVVAHLLAWPLGMLWACAAMPFAFPLFDAEIGRIEDPEAVGWFIAWKVLWAGGAAFVLAHVAAVPWAFGREGGRGRRIFLVGIGVLAGLGLLAGGGGWAWLHLR